MKEPILEPVLRRMRLRRVLPWIQDIEACELLDVGCGWEARLLRELEPHLARGVGIDFKAPSLPSKKLSTISSRFADQLPFDTASFDVVTMLAVLEHLDHPKQIVTEIARVLRPGGRLILTVPSSFAKPVLEFLAFRLGIINRAEIEDHKTYFDRNDLFDLFSDRKCWEVVEHRYFQWRFNNLLIVRRLRGNPQQSSIGAKASALGALHR